LRASEPDKYFISEVIMARNSLFLALLGRLFPSTTLLTRRGGKLLTTASPGSAVDQVNDPFAGLGLGVTVFGAFGATSNQLTVTSTGAIVAGLTAATAGTKYRLGVLAVSGNGTRRVADTFEFTAVTPTPAPAPTTFDYTITNDGSASTPNSFANILALPGTTLSGKRIGVAPGNYSIKTINIRGNSNTITFAATDASNPPVIDRMVLKNAVKMQFEDMAFVSSAWPSSNPFGNQMEPCVAYSASATTNDVIDQVVFERCDTRGNYRGNTAANAIPIASMEFPEYASMSPRFNDSGELVSVEVINPLIDTLTPDGQRNGTYPMIFGPTNDLTFTTVPTATFTVVDGIIQSPPTVLTAGKAVGSKANTSINNQVGILSKVITWTGMQPMKNLLPYGHQIVSGGGAYGVIGSVAYRNGKMRNLANGFKMTPTTGDAVVDISYNDFDRIYQDTVSIGRGAGDTTKLPKVVFAFNRGCDLLSKMGDPQDPHSDWIQIYMNDFRPSTIGSTEVDIVGNIFYRGRGRGGVPQMFLSEVDANPSPYGYTGRIVGNYILTGVVNGLHVARMDNCLMTNNVAIAYSTARAEIDTISMIAAGNPDNDAQNITISNGDCFFGYNVGEAVRSNANGNDKYFERRNVGIGKNGALVPMPTMFPGWTNGVTGNGPQSFDEVLSAVGTMASQYADLGNGPGMINYTTRTIDWTKVHSGVVFNTVYGAATSTEVWSDYRRVLSDATVVIPSGVKVQIADSSTGTNQQSVVVGPATIMVARAKYIRTAVVTSPNVSTSTVTNLTINGYATPFVVMTAQVLAFNAVDNNATAYSTTPTTLATDTGVSKVLIAIRYKADTASANATIFAGGSTSTFRNYYPANNSQRLILGSSTVCRAQLGTAPALGVMQTHLMSLDLTKTTDEEVFKWLIEGTQQSFTAGSTTFNKSGTTKLNMSSVLTGGMSLLSGPAGVGIFDGSIEMFYMDWGNDSYALPDITDPLVRDRFTRDRIGADGSGVTGSAPKICYYGSTGPVDGSTANTWNASAGLDNRGALTSKPITKAAGTFAGAAEPAVAAPFSSMATNGYVATMPATPTDLSLTAFDVQDQGYDSAASLVTWTRKVQMTKRTRTPNTTNLTSNGQAVSSLIYASTTFPNSPAVNNSAIGYHKAVAQCISLDRQIVGNTIGGADMPVEVEAYHEGAGFALTAARKPVACVEFIISDGVTTLAPIRVVAPERSLKPTWELFAIPVYALPQTDISSLADNAVIKVDYRVYPWIGTAVLDSRDTTRRDGPSTRFYERNTALFAAPVYVYAAAAANSAIGVGTPQTTGAVGTLAQAKATPFLTPLAAYNALVTSRNASVGVSGCVVMFGDNGGTPWVWGTPTANAKNTCAAVRFVRDPNVTKAQAACSFSGFTPRMSLPTLAASPALAAFMHEGLQISRATGSSFGNNTVAAEYMSLDTDVNHNAQTVSIFGTGVTYAWHIGGSEIGVTANANLGTSGHILWRGTLLNANGFNIDVNWITGSRVLKCSAVNLRATSGVVANVAIAATELNDPQSATIISNGTNAVDGLVIVNNSGEWLKKIGADSGPASMWIMIGGDGGTKTVKNIMVWNNTLWGASNMGRWKIGYNDVAGQNLVHEAISEVGNIGPQLHSKSDQFANDAGNIGNWNIHLGVGMRGSLWPYYSTAAPDNAGVRPEFYGIGSLRGSALTTAELRASGNDPKFVVDGGIVATGDNIYAGDGVGGGDLRLNSGSPAIGRIPFAMLPFTIDGAARPSVNDNAGARTTA
jgi:hypothetical protein